MVKLYSVAHACCHEDAVCVPVKSCWKYVYTCVHASSIVFESTRLGSFG